MEETETNGENPFILILFSCFIYAKWLVICLCFLSIQIEWFVVEMHEKC